MAIPSRVLGSGVNSLSTVSICGDGVASVTAAGTSAGNATTLTYVYNNVTTVAAGAGVKLPPTEMGETIIVKNSGANPLTVYAYDANSTINNAGFGTINADCSAMFLPSATRCGKNCRVLAARFLSCITGRFRTQRRKPLCPLTPLMR